jgi:tRNA-specific 2-thiouridylase
MCQPRIRVVAALSGGVDSSVAAYLAQQHPRYDVVCGVYMHNWDAADEDPAPANGSGGGGSPRGSSGAAPAVRHAMCAQDRLDAERVAASLRLPFHAVDFAAEYWTTVFEPLLAAYRAGTTTNPDCTCNVTVKFDAFAEHVLRRFDAAFIVTGHYATNKSTWDFLESRVPGHGAVGGSPFHLAKAAAAANDQSYFLCRVPSAHLQRGIFPLAAVPTKVEVRAIALAQGLHTTAKPTSTGLCFIGQRPFRPFLRQYLEDGTAAVQRIASAGNVVRVGASEPLCGVWHSHERKAKLPAKAAAALCAAPLQHEGVTYYTLGQRLRFWRGPGHRVEACYVCRRDAGSNTLHVCESWDDAALHTSECGATGVMFYDAALADEFAGADGHTLDVLVSCRYQETPVSCRISRRGSGATLSFAVPHRAISAGQVACFYRDHHLDDGRTFTVCVGSAVLCDTD